MGRDSYQNNQLVQAGNRSYNYDLNGNLTSESMGSFSNEYVYNYENRLVKATNDKYANFYNGDQPFFGEITFAYDSFGRKIEKIADPLKKPQVETTRYLYDGLGVNVLTEYQMLSWDLPVQENSVTPDVAILGNGNGNGGGPGNGGGSGGGGNRDDSNGLPFRGGKLSKYNEYYYGNGNLLAMWHSIDPSQGNGYGVHENPKRDFRYYHKDALGSIVMMTGKHAEPVEQYEYDAFGHPYQGHFLHNPNNNNPYGFTGQRYEPELGTYSFAYRDYNPHSMRWMTSDPVKDGANWYQYVGSDPVNYWDPLGLELEENTLSAAEADNIFGYVEEGDIVAEALYLEGKGPKITILGNTLLGNSYYSDSNGPSSSLIDINLASAEFGVAKIYDTYEYGGWNISTIKGTVDLKASDNESKLYAKAALVELTGEVYIPLPFTDKKLLIGVTGDLGSIGIDYDPNEGYFKFGLHYGAGADLKFGLK